MKSIAILGLALAGGAAARSFHPVSDNIPHHKGNLQVNDFTILKKDDADNELMGAGAAPRNLQPQSNTRPIYFILQEAPQPKPEPKQRMWWNGIPSFDDEADNEMIVLHQKPQTQKPEAIINKDDEADNELAYGRGAAPKNPQPQPETRPIYFILQEAPQPKPEPKQRMWWNGIPSFDDEADSELAVAVKAPHNKGKTAVKDQDEIAALGSLLKSANKDKEGKVKVDGIHKKEAKKTEGPKNKKFLGL